MCWELGLRRSMWTGLTAKSIKALTSLKSYPKSPTAEYIIDTFSTPRDEGLKYGQRLHGYFVPPDTGGYIFAASCTDECKLYLSKSDEQDRKDLIISHEAGSVQDQSSDPITLKGGHTYFMEALSYHDTDDAPMKVGVRLPSGKILAPIPSQYLKLERGALVDEEYDRLPSASIRSLLTEVSFPDTPTRWKSLSDFNLLEYENEGNHGHRISGFFFARETGKYKFFGTCPNGCRLYLSDDDTCNKRSLVLEYQSPFAKSTRSAVIENATTRNEILLEPTTMSIDKNLSTRALDLPSLFEVSKTFDLQAGLHYYIEALQATKGNQANSVKIGVVQPSGKTYYPIKKDLLKQFAPSKHGIVREVWRNVKGENIRDFTINPNYPSLPGEVELLSNFDAPANEKYNYGQRLKGYFVAPMTGDYRFVMSCDRKCEFYMSPSEKADRKRKILKLTKKTARHEFGKYPEEQVSSPIHLDIGQQYYVEALHKAATGLDHMSIGVTIPTGANEWPIPKKYLRFRPKDKLSSPMTVPCNYNLDETLATAKSITTQKMHKQAIFEKDESSLRNSQNDIAILGGGDSETNTDTLNIQDEGGEYPVSKINIKNFDEEDKNTATATAKVKVTRLQLPFGTGDSSSAAEALQVMQKINQEDKQKLKLKKNGKGEGFTLTGLPADLNQNDVQKIAKGVASVIEPEKDSGSGDDTKLGSKEDIDKDFGEEAKPDFFEDTNKNKNKFKQEKLQPKTDNDKLDPIAQLALAADQKNPKPTENVPESELGISNTNEGNNAAAENFSKDVNVSPGAISEKIENMQLSGAPKPGQVDIESVNVVGNIVNNNNNNNVNSAGNVPEDSKGAGVENSDLLKTPTVVQHITPLMKLGTESIIMSHKGQKELQPVLQPIAAGRMPNGDSIGAPVSDIMPGLTGILSQPPQQHHQQHVGVGNGVTPSLGVAPIDSPINQLTDYDILDVDLEGLNNMKKMVQGPRDSPVGRFIEEKVDDAELPPGLEDAAFVGDRLNTEANEFNNLLTLKKKRIPKTKGKNLIQKASDNNPNKTDAVFNKKSKVKLTITNYHKRVRRSKTEVLNESKITHKKNIVIKAKTEVSVSIKHDKNKAKA